MKGGDNIFSAFHLYIIGQLNDSLNVRNNDE